MEWPYYWPYWKVNVANKWGTSFFIQYDVKLNMLLLFRHSSNRWRLSYLCVERESTGRKYVHLDTQCTIIILLLNTWLPDVSRSCKLQLLPPGLGIFTLYTQLHSAKYVNVNLGCSGLDRNEGMDQTEGLNDAPGPLVYADTDVPQIPNVDPSSITLSRETVRSLGFLSRFFSSLFFTFTLFSNTDKPRNTLNWHSCKHTLWPTVTPMQDPVLKTIAITCHQVSCSELLWKQTRTFRKWALSEKHKPGLAELGTDC